LRPRSLNDINQSRPSLLITRIVASRRLLFRNLDIPDIFSRHFCCENYVVVVLSSCSAFGSMLDLKNVVSSSQIIRAFSICYLSVSPYLASLDG